MRYRIDDLAAATGLAVDAIRHYQAEGLLPGPSHEGHVAWYDGTHRDRLARIRELESKGYPLAMIRRMLDEDPADAALVQALAGPVPGEADEPGSLTRDELAAAVELPVALIESLEREGFLLPRDTSGEPRYSPADVDTLRAGMSLLSAGVPLDELLGLARRHDAAMRAVADEAVDLFVRFVRDPIQGSAASEDEASEQLVAAFEEMLPATGQIVAHHFRRLLLASATARVTADDDPRALDALRRADTGR